MKKSFYKSLAYLSLSCFSLTSHENIFASEPEQFHDANPQTKDQSPFETIKAPIEAPIEEEEEDLSNSRNLPISSDDQNPGSDFTDENPNFFPSDPIEQKTEDPSSPEHEILPDDQDLGSSFTDENPNSSSSEGREKEQTDPQSPVLPNKTPETEQPPSKQPKSAEKAEQTIDQNNDDLSSDENETTPVEDNGITEFNCTIEEEESDSSSPEPQKIFPGDQNRGSSSTDGNSDSSSSEEEEEDLSSHETQSIHTGNQNLGSNIQNTSKSSDSFSIEEIEHKPEDSSRSEHQEIFPDDQNLDSNIQNTSENQNSSSSEESEDEQTNHQSPNLSNEAPEEENSSTLSKQPESGAGDEQPIDQNNDNLSSDENALTTVNDNGGNVITKVQLTEETKGRFRTIAIVSALVATGGLAAFIYRGQIAKLWNSLTHKSSAKTRFSNRS